MESLASRVAVHGDLGLHQMSKHLVFKRGTDLRFQILRSETPETSQVGSVMDAEGLKTFLALLQVLGTLPPMSLVYQISKSEI